MDILCNKPLVIGGTTCRKIGVIRFSFTISLNQCECNVVLWKSSELIIKRAIWLNELLRNIFLLNSVPTFYAKDA